MPAPLSRPAYLLVVLLFCLTWSSAFPAAKIAIGVGPPSLFLGVRFLAAGLLLTGWALARGQLRGKVPWLALLLLGVVNQAGYQGLAWQGMRTTSAGLATIVNSLNPVLIAALAAPLLGETLSWRKVAGLLLGVAGAAFVVRNRIALGEDATGVGWLVLSLASMIVGTLAFKLLDPAVSLVAAVGVQQLGAGAVLLAVGFLTEDASAARPGWTAALVMLWFVFVVSIGAMLLWFWLLRAGTAFLGQRAALPDAAARRRDELGGARRAREPARPARHRAGGARHLARHAAGAGAGGAQAVLASGSIELSLVMSATACLASSATIAST